MKSLISRRNFLDNSNNNRLSGLIIINPSLGGKSYVHLRA